MTKTGCKINMVTAQRDSGLLAFGKRTFVFSLQAVSLVVIAALHKAVIKK